MNRNGIFVVSGRLPKRRRDTSKTKVILDEHRYTAPGTLVVARDGHEELTRQRAVSWLKDHAGFAPEQIATEVHLGVHLGDPRIRDRADIVVFRNGRDGRRPLLVVECKSGGSPDDEEVIAQVQRYAEKLRPRYGLIVAGNNGRLLEISRTRQCVKLLPPISWPRWRAEKFPLPAPAKDQFRRWSRRELNEAKSLRALLGSHDYMLGRNSTGKWVPFAMDFAGLLADQGSHLAPSACQGLSVEDLGPKVRKFRNSAGGVQSSERCRCFLVKWNGRLATVGIMIIANAELSGDRRFGNQRGTTCLSVFIDGRHDGDQQGTPHISLHFPLDKFLKEEGDYYRLVHSGRLTARTPQPKSEVLAYVKRQAPDLVLDNEIQLGRIHATNPVTFKSARRLILNTLRYALLRDDFRELQGGQNRVSRR